VSTLAHDVRGPLGTIRGSVRTVLRLRGQLDDRSEADLLEGIDRQCSRLLRLANGLLDLARLEEGRLELDLGSVSLRETVAEALSYADPTGAIQVDIDPDVCLLADAERLEQIIVNLATNSLRHGEAPFVISSTVADGWVEVTFSDSGRGVTAELVDSLFEPFRRGDTAGSVGFGLWIVRMLAEAQGGSVRYEPNMPSGARFAVRLPVSRLVQAGGGPRAAGERNPPLGC
jgi:signal transduction histidine kinase